MLPRKISTVESEWNYCAHQRSSWLALLRGQRGNRFLRVIVHLERCFTFRGVYAFTEDRISRVEIVEVRVPKSLELLTRWGLREIIYCSARRIHLPQYLRSPCQSKADRLQKRSFAGSVLANYEINPSQIRQFDALKATEIMRCERFEHMIVRGRFPLLEYGALTFADDTARGCCRAHKPHRSSTNERSEYLTFAAALNKVLSVSPVKVKLQIKARK